MSSYGTTYNFDPYTASDKKMCVNGSFYGLSEIEGPAVFTSVAGPAYREKQYSAFLYALSGAGWLNLFGSQTYAFTLLLPDNTTFNESEYYLNQYTTGNVLEALNADGNLESVSGTTCADIVSVHTALQEVTLATTGVQIIENLIPYNYWYVKDGKITSSNRFNKLLSSDVYTMENVFLPFTELTYNGGSWNNGKVYTYETNGNGLFQAGMETETFHAELSGSNSRSLPYFAFGQLLKKAGLIYNGVIIGLAAERVIAFIPTNDAIDQALRNNKIPGAEDASVDYENETLKGEYDATTLRAYLMNYFIRASQITSIPYPGSAMESGAYLNFAGKYINYNQSASSLSVQLQGGTTIKVIDDYDYFPFAYNDGCFHFIESILE